MTEADYGEALRDQVLAAGEAGTALQIVGGASKAFLGRTPTGERLETGAHRGVVSYEPTELVVTARAGTPLADLERTVAEQGQMLAFEPPYFSPTATIGGIVATGLSGPRRPFTGAVRDFVLGVKIINGRGETLSFGGQVMKNVAGYDVSRLMAGAHGTLGVLLEISLKVLPMPPREETRAFELAPDEALQRLIELGTKAVPLSAACYTQGRLYLRLSGAVSAVDAAARQLGGDPAPADVWTAVRELTHPSLEGEGALWRLSVPAHVPFSDAIDVRLLDWAGAQRWVRAHVDAHSIRDWASRHGGHATQFRDGDRESDVFQPLSPGLDALHRRLKTAFDPAGILNRGRFYRDM